MVRFSPRTRYRGSVFWVSNNCVANAPQDVNPSCTPSRGALGMHFRLVSYLDSTQAHRLNIYPRKEFFLELSAWQLQKSGGVSTRLEVNPSCHYRTTMQSLSPIKMHPPGIFFGWPETMRKLGVRFPLKKFWGSAHPPPPAQRRPPWPRQPLRPQPPATAPHSRPQRSL